MSNNILVRDANGTGIVMRTNNSAGVHTPVHNTTNINSRVRDACEVWPNPSVWSVDNQSSGDLILQRGNTGGAGWIEISKNPFGANTETAISLVQRISLPVRLTTMVSMTHRNAGEQICSIEFISDDAVAGNSPINEPIPVEILNASQTTSTITVNFATPPATPFRVGQVVSIYGFVDTRLNVNNATVASTPTSTQITIVGNDYTLTSTTIASTLGNGTAFIERRDMLGLARNGIAIVHGNATATNKRIYVRSQGGLARPSGTLAGAHAITTGTDVATAAVTAPFADAWLPPLETVLIASRDGVYIADRAPDAGGALTARYRNSQVVPNPERQYITKFRIRSTPSLTRPVAKILSIVKSGTTTTTITTDSPHGLTTGQYVGFYGVNNQTAFANQTTGLVCTVTGDTTFTVVHGSATTATSYGGFVVRFQGQQPLGGAIAQVAQSVSRTDNLVTVIGNATWAAPTTIGNLVELIGFKNTSNGDDLGLDGTYVVRNISTTSLVLEPVDASLTGSNIASVNCGGGVVQRLGFRIHGITAVDFQPMMTEGAYKGSADGSEATMVTGTVTIGSGTVTTVSSMTSGNLGIPGIIADVASAAITTTTTTSAITPTFGTSYEVNIPVTAVSGTNPTLDLGIEESDDSGTNWFRVYDFPRITATGIYRSPKLQFSGNRVRYVQTISGTSPSFTRSINRLQASDSINVFRQLIDRSVVLTTLNSVTPVLNTQGIRNGVQLVINLGAATTPPAIQLEGSEDNGLTWYPLGSPLTGSASATVQNTVTGVQPAFIRARVSTAGVTVTMGYVLIKGF